VTQADADPCGMKRKIRMKGMMRMKRKMRI
jgi:hypothetical protein